jgi:hypothetical protein
MSRLHDAISYIEGLLHLTPDTKVSIAQQLKAAQAKQDLTHPTGIVPTPTVAPTTQPDPAMQPHRTDIYAVGPDIQDWLNGRDVNNPPSKVGAHPGSGVDVETLTKFWLAGGYSDDAAGYEAAFQAYVAAYPGNSVSHGTVSPVLGTGTLLWSQATDADKYYALATLKRRGADVPVEMNRVFGGDVQWNQWEIDHEPTLASYNPATYPTSGPLYNKV